MKVHVIQYVYNIQNFVLYCVQMMTRYSSLKANKEDCLRNSTLLKDTVYTDLSQ